LRELRECFDQLRKISHPQPETIAAFDVQGLYEPRTFKSRQGFGTFAKEANLNNFLPFGL